MEDISTQSVYKVAKSYSYEKNGFKVNEAKQRVIVYASTSGFFWFFGILLVAICIFSLANGVLVGLGFLGFALIFFAALSKRTVFDIRKKEVRQEVLFIPWASAKISQISSYHTTVVYTNGRLSGYNFDLNYSSLGFSIENGGMMKGIASFPTPAQLQKFQVVVTRILDEMRTKNS